MTPNHINGIDIQGFPSHRQELENARSTCILEGRFLLAQANDKHGYEFVQRLQEISLWAKAGSPRRALQLARALQTAAFLNPAQKQHVATCTAELEAQLTEWLVTLLPVQNSAPVPVPA